MNKTTLFIYTLIIILILIVSEIAIYWQRKDDNSIDKPKEITVVKVVDRDYRIVNYENELYWQSKSRNYINGDYWVMGGKLK